MPRNETLEDLAFLIADHQARITQLGEKWAAILTERLDQSEKKFLETLKSGIEAVRRLDKNSPASIKSLISLEKKLAAIRKAAYDSALEELKDDAGPLAANESKWAKRITIEFARYSKERILRDLSPKKARNLIWNSIIQGKTFLQWFDQNRADDMARITTMIQMGVSQGWTIPQITQRIMGTKANNYTDGLMQTSRIAATRLARTLCSGIANEAKQAFYEENEDVVTGVEWLSTLDGRTCLDCAALDHVRWKTRSLHPVPPVHPNCRCVLLPVTELTDLGEDAPRPKANADFMKLAQEAYEKKYPGKKWKDLSMSTRKKYYYQAMREYERIHGKGSAYSQVPGSMKFKDYFLQMSDQQKLHYLGPEKFKLWKAGRLSVDDFIAPYPRRQFTVAELKAKDQAAFKK